MKLSEKDLHFIDRAILNQLSEEELVLLQSKLKNSAFKRAWETQRAIHATIERKSYANDKANPEKPSRFWVWIALLTVLILCAIATYYVQNKQLAPQEDLYLAYYQAFPNEIDPVTKGAVKQYQSAFQYYEIGDYEKAISLLIPKLADNNARWYYAQTMMAIGDLSVARDILEQFIRANDETYAIHAKWYLALLNIKEKKLSETKILLNKLSNSDHLVYRRKALELLTKIGD